MKLFTPLLLCLSLAFGTIASMTAYLPRLDIAEKAIASGGTLELGASSGKIVAADGSMTPVALSGEALTPELVSRLRAAGVERVRVREFSFARWSHSWLFALSSAGLVVGAVLVRRQKRDSVAASAGEPTGGTLSPSAAMAALRESLRRLDAELPGLRETKEGMHQVTETLGELQATHIDSILQSRERIIARGGPAGFAAFMSAFSVMERQINRAWSASADGEFDEVADCLKRAVILLEDADKLLPRK